MPTLFNPNRRKGVFMIPSGATKSPTPTPPSFQNIYSLSLDGVDDFVDCGDSDTFSFGNGSTDSPFSISTWVKLDSISGNSTIVSKDLGLSTREYTLFVLSTGKLRIFLKNQGGNNQQSIDSTTALLTGQWYHIGCTYNGVGGNNAADGLTLYVNGSAETPTNVIKNGYIAMSNTTAPFRIGKYSTGNLMAGSVDEVAVFSSELTSGNITSIYNSGVPNNLDDLTTPPTAWYRNGDNGSYKSPQWLIPENSNVANSRISNYSFSYDGVDDIIQMGDVLDFDYNEPFTISAWINLEAFTYSFAGVVSKQEASGNFRGYFLLIDETSGAYNLKFILGNTLSNRIRIQGTTDLLGLGWTHIACTYDGSTNASGTKLYINGSLETLNAGLTQDTLGSNTTLNSASFNIGSRSGSRFFEGNIDEVSVFNSELSASEVNTLYGGGNPTTITGAVAHWKMGEEATFSTNWTVPDAVGSNNGTSANMTIEDRVGNAPNSDNNAVSFNMTESDRETDVPT